jgi:phosphonate transport system substrate-binding protein
MALLFGQPAWAAPINIGSVSTEPAAEIKKFLPFANYLGKELQSEGIDRGKVVVAKNISQMAALLREGKVDLYIDSPFPVLAASHLSGSKILLRRWKKGAAEYRSVIFARKDSGINRLEDLKGKMVAFQESFSSTAYFLPKVILLQKGLKLSAKMDPTETVAPGEVGYVFSQADENTILWVLRKRVMAGATDEQSYEKEARGNLDSLKVIEISYSLPRHVVSYRADLPPKLIARIKEILIGMDQSEEGRKVLKEFESTTKFDELSDQAMAPLLKSVKLIHAELGMK